jgi:PleD family two-component response regulator
MTISIGATLVRPVDTFDSLLERADDLLYRSKQAGRNQVTLEL